MFLFLLGGSLVLGATLLAAASFSDGTLLALKTATCPSAIPYSPPG